MRDSLLRVFVLLVMGGKKVLGDTGGLSCRTAGDPFSSNLSAICIWLNTFKGRRIWWPSPPFFLGGGGGGLFA